MPYSRAALRPRIFFFVSSVRTDPVSFVSVLRNFEGHEFVDQPFRRPDAVVAAVQELVRPNPEQQFGHDMAEIAGTGVNEGQHDSEAAVNVGLLRGDPAEIVKTRQAAVLNDEVQVLERCGDVVDIGNVERVPVQGNDRRTLVNVNILDAVLLRRLKKFIGFLVGELVALRVALPFRGVELDALGMILLAILVQTPPGPWRRRVDQRRC